METTTQHIASNFKKFRNGKEVIEKKILEEASHLIKAIEVLHPMLHKLYFNRNICVHLDLSK